MTNVEILQDLNEEEWLKLREGSIGGTTMGKLCSNTPPWYTNNESEREKHMTRGRRMEPRIVEAVDRYFHTAKSLTGWLWRWPEERFHYTPDGTVLRAAVEGLLEIKSVSKKLPEEPYLSHEFQCRWGMMLMDLPLAMIVYCIGEPKEILEKHLKHYWFYRDKSLEPEMIRRAKAELRRLDAIEAAKAM